MAGEGWEFFADDEYGKASNMNDILRMLRHHMDEHDMPFEHALDILFDIIRPGLSERSHDVKGMFMGAMGAYGYLDEAKSFEAIYVNSMPWGVGFAIGVEKGYDFMAMEKGVQHAIMQSFCVVLRCGGVTAELDANDQIHIRMEDGSEERTMSVDDILATFRQEMETELGPSPHDPDDPVQRWYPS